MGKRWKTGKLFIVQSRPETVHSNQEGHFYTEYIIDSKKILHFMESQLEIK